ncbi:alanine--tRNA ligase [Rickettsia felis str. Pedreira]|uniref:Alanine--tRNA ligase n=2 Tax=Rickettsia felis TaxID=42862 RepID=SYA_RICFE|nr:alanine--tRNA ligase [Rickettsia felis]Q4UJT5.1 RecName: Full=Alanine--tRNA ligase; AltName: Full=Alanyl-tRNA synthetase; Short=AlaRS [Rickettsia felis URRWXCal2]AAY62204.1 Alanyl-tRNA synthetase [Rickettsia felis URRWXCal2]KJV58609.1 alanine--tRNA ligase [Rickettsia felis str. Pedreira]
MTKFTTEEVRSKFITYFKANNHTHVPASSLIPHNDPSLMFVNSGMVQFKNVFTGQEKRPYNKAVTSQKSLRAGGKHNDLENVGYTARHHTFFEMLGNFSFGDYFKEQAIYYAWNLLTKEFELPKDKLYVTVYHTDEEAASYWKKIAGFRDDRIIRIKTNDNFWSMGDTGPCGPCSEIFYDHGEQIYGGLPGTKDEDGDRFIEIWNMVFMQYEQIDKDTRIELPQKSIDTGMGLERMTAVLQHVNNNYDIDLFQEIINFTENIVKVKIEGEAKFSYRVIADHLRASSFLIADGVIPSNEGRGYVLRRIMRRAMRHAHMLGSKEPLMYKLLPKLVDLMGNVYPELKRAESFISSILEQEEIRFKTTLERGLKLLTEETETLTKGNELSGEIAFKLYDTYGFPLDLTEDILKNRDISVDHKRFEEQMLAQKERARKSWLGSGESKTDQLWFDIKEQHGSTEFLGYTLNEAECKIIALIKDNNLVNDIKEIDTQFLLISNQTPFYGESGGQMGDIGMIFSKDSEIEVIDTLKYLGSIIVHKCILKKGQIKIGENANFSIDIKYRQNLRIHHSATHILHAVLHEVLGKHVTQKGSLVAPTYLRFDISHSKAVTNEEITLIEDKVNEIIRDNHEVDTTLMTTEDAVKQGAMALFGEKYDSEVRVVKMGETSLELCGGTHVRRTGDIGCFKITSESAIAAGVRRIEAVCGEFVIKLMREKDSLLKSIESSLKTNKNELITKVNNILERNKELEKELEKVHLARLDLSIEQIEKQAEDIKGVKLIYRYIENLDNKVLRQAAENLTKKVEDLIVVYITGNNDKLSITVAVSKAITDKYKAGIIAKELSLFLGGSGGGGQASLAQAGGNDIGKLTNIQEKLHGLLTVS